MYRSLRDEGLLVLEGRGAILKVAREVSRIMEASAVEGAVIGGVAVVLHGHVRTTMDVDVLVPDDGKSMGAALQKKGYAFDPNRIEFVKKGVPVHLVLSKQVRIAPLVVEELDGVRTVSLADLINIKLDLGLRDPLRAQDIADVIGLIRARGLTSAFAAKLHKSLRVEFRKLARAIAGRGKS